MTKLVSAKNRATLQDVATRAGVSPSTVSAVMTGKCENRRISEDTRLRVQLAAQQLSYSPNLLHRSIRRGRTHIISLFNSFRVRHRNDLYLNRLLGAIEESSGDFGYNVLVHTDFSQSPEETFQFLNGGFADGLILFGSTGREPLLPLLREATLPIVLVGPRQPDPTFMSISDDNDHGMSLVAEALLSRGHRRIAAVSDMGAGIADATGRVARLRHELAQAGLALSDEFVVPFDGDDPEGVARKILDLSPRPTAVFVWHDGNGYRILDALEAMGISIPEDLSLVGYDGIVWPAKSSHVLASVEVPLDDIAREGVRLLNQMILEGVSEPRSITLPVRFNPGTTLGPPASNEGNKSCNAKHLRLLSCSSSSPSSRSSPPSSSRSLPRPRKPPRRPRV